MSEFESTGQIRKKAKKEGPELQFRNSWLSFPLKGSCASETLNGYCLKSRTALHHLVCSKSKGEFLDIYCENEEDG